MKLADWKQIHRNDSFEKLIDALSNEVYFLKCDVYSFGQNMVNHNLYEAKYDENEIYNTRYPRIEFIQQRLLELYKEATEK